MNPSKRKLIRFVTRLRFQVKSKGVVRLIESFICNLDICPLDRLQRVKAKRMAEFHRERNERWLPILLMGCRQTVPSDGATHFKTLQIIRKISRRKIPFTMFQDRSKHAFIHHDFLYTTAA